MNEEEMEIIIDDDLLETNKTKSSNELKIEKNAQIEVHDLEGIEFPIDDDIKRKLQKNDLLKEDESYETEISIQEENIPIIEENFVGESFVDDIPLIQPASEVVKHNSLESPPTKESSKTIFQDTQINDDPLLNPEIKSSKDIKITDDYDTNEDKETTIDDKPIIENNLKVETKSVNLDEEVQHKKYISRQEVIFSDEKSIQRYNPMGEILKNKPPTESINTRVIKNNLAMIIMITISIVVICSAYFTFKNYNSPDVFKYNLSEKDKIILTEEYFFITKVEEFLIQINSSVEQEKNIIDFYISGDKTKEDTIKELDVVLQTKQNLKDLYDKIIPLESEVLETKKLSNSIIDGTIICTNDILEKINKDESKMNIVSNFNQHVETNNSNIYMYNQYVSSVFKARNITVTISGDKFLIDTAWMKNN